MAIMRVDPQTAVLANRTRHLSLLPVNRNVRAVEPLLFLCLLTVVNGNWSHKGHRMVVEAFHQDFCIQIA